MFGKIFPNACCTKYFWLLLHFTLNLAVVLIFRPMAVIHQPLSDIRIQMESSFSYPILVILSSWVSFTYSLISIMVRRSPAVGNQPSWYDRNSLRVRGFSRLVIIRL